MYTPMNLKIWIFFHPDRNHPVTNYESQDKLKGRYLINLYGFNVHN